MSLFRSAAAPGVPSAWPVAALTLAAGLGLMLTVQAPTVALLVASWSKDPFAHGYVVVPVAAGLVWTRRAQLAAVEPRPTFWALPVLAAISFVWVLGNLTATTIVQLACLVAMVVAFTWAVLGTAVLRALVFPLGFLIFALPLGDFAVPALQQLTAHLALALLRLIGVPGFIEGHVIAIGPRRWLVADACSGINYLVSSLALGYIYAGTAYRRLRNRAGFMIASALLPLAANAVRVCATVLVSLTGATVIASGMGHELFGLALFAVISFGLVASCGSWRDDVADVEPEPAGAGRPVLVGSVKPVIVSVLGLTLVSGATAGAATWPGTRTADGHAPVLSVAVSGPWVPAPGEGWDWRPRFETPSDEQFASYRAGDRVVTLYAAHYRADRHDVKLATATNVLFGHEWWMLSDRRVPVTLDGGTISVRELVLRSTGARQLRVWSWYRVDRQFTGNDITAKALLAKSRLLRSNDGALGIALATDVRGDDDATLADFVSHVTFDVAVPAQRASVEARRE